MRGYLCILFIFVPWEEWMECSRSTWTCNWPSTLKFCHALPWKVNRSIYVISLRRLRGHLPCVCKWHLGTAGVKDVLKLTAYNIFKPDPQGPVFSTLCHIHPWPHDKHSPSLVLLTPTRLSYMGKNRHKVHSFSHLDFPKWIMVNCMQNT